MARSPRPTKNPRNPSGRESIRDPDIMLRLILGAIVNQEIADNDPTDAMIEVVALLTELAVSITRNGLPKRDTLMTACRELVALPPKPSAD